MDPHKHNKTAPTRGRPTVGLPIKRSMLITKQIDNAIAKYAASDPARPTFSQAVRSLIIIGLKANGIAP